MDIPSVSRNEQEIAGWVEQFLGSLPWLEVVRFKNTIVARTHFGLTQRILLAGHLDTVVPSGNESAVIDQFGCAGIGSCDMKGGIAVMLCLAKSKSSPTRDYTLVFYSCEEVDRSENELHLLMEEDPTILACDAAILCEPTGAVVEAGCQGSIRCKVKIRGKRAHSARPWMGVNSIHRSAKLLSSLSTEWQNKVTIDNCEYLESLQAVAISGGVAGNVIPDLVEVVINYRFAPDKTLEQAIGWLNNYLLDWIDHSLGDEVQILDATGGAPPLLDDLILAELVRTSSQGPRAKLGLTDVGLFADLGIPATNFGPGDSRLAHSPDERVEFAELASAFETLSKLF